MVKNGLLGKFVQDQVGLEHKRTTKKYSHSEESPIRETMDRMANFSYSQTQNLCTEDITPSRTKASGLEVFLNRRGRAFSLSALDVCPSQEPTPHRHRFEITG
jgi:hypothetical protein